MASNVGAVSRRGQRRSLHCPPCPAVAAVGCTALFGLRRPEPPQRFLADFCPTAAAFLGPYYRGNCAYATEKYDGRSNQPSFLRHR